MAIPSQAPDSSVAGFLQPDPPVLPLDDEALEDFLQQWIAGVANLDNTLVRPRWQPEPPNLPDYGTDWAACGIVSTKTDTFAWVGGNDPSFDEFQRHQVFDILTSFYGPHATSFAGRLRDGAQISQNREPLLLNEMGLVEVGEQRRVPELIKMRWTNREDVMVRIRRRIVRRYRVLTILEAQGQVKAQPPDSDLVFTSGFSARKPVG